MSQNNVPLTVGILIFHQVQVLDVAGPFEIFSVTRLNETSRWEESSISLQGAVGLIKVRSSLGYRWPTLDC